MSGVTESLQNCTDSVHCSVEDCDAPVKARGWCIKHYRRWQRTGDPTRTRKPGPTSNAFLDTLKEVFRDYWSDRTIITYHEAMMLLAAVGETTNDPELPKSALERATRQNGTINVSRLYDIAIMMYACAEVES